MSARWKAAGAVEERGEKAMCWCWTSTAAARRRDLGGDNHTDRVRRRKTRHLSPRARASASSWQLADGTGGVERLTKAEKGRHTSPTPGRQGRSRPQIAVATARSPFRCCRSDRHLTAFDLLKADSTVLTTAVFSPDGRWLAYTVGSDAISSTGGPNEGMSILVQPIPPTGTRFQVYTNDRQSHAPLWTPDGKELLFVGLPGTFWAVTVATQPTLAFGHPAARPRAFASAPPTIPRPFDMTPDGRIVSPVSTAAQSAASDSRMAIVTNWFDELKAKVK